MRRAIRILNLRRLARVRLRLVVAVVAVAAGSSLALGVVIVNGSTSYSLNRLTGQVAGGAALRVVGATSDGGLNFEALAATAGTPGVKAAIPVVEAISAVRTHGTRNQAVLVIGVNCTSASASGLGCQGAGSRSAVGAGAANPSTGVFIAQNLRQQLRPGSWLETNLGIQSLRHATALPGLNSVNRGDVVIMSLAGAQKAFTRDGRVDDIFVLPQPGVALSVLQHRLTAAVGPWNGVVDATAAPASVSLALGAFTPVLALLAILASGIAIVLVYNVIALTLEERKREHAIIAAIGASPGTMILGALLEAGTLGAIGGVLGTLGGVVVAQPIVTSLSHITLGLVGIPITEHITSSTFVLGLVVGVALGLLAAVQPVRRAVRADIAAEISGREQRQRTSRLATTRRGVILLGLAAAGALVSWLGSRNGSLEAWQPNAAVLGFVVALVLAIAAVGAWAPVSIGAISRSGRLRQGVARLGVANLVREPGRTGVMAVAIGTAVGVAFITASYNRAIDQDIASAFNRSASAHSVLVTTIAAGSGYNTDGQIPPSVQTALGRLPGVTRVDSVNGELTGHTVGQLVLVEATTHPSFASWTLYNGTDSRQSFEQGNVLIGASLARRDDLRRGSRLTLDTPTGTATVRVQGVWSNGDATGDNVFMPASEQNRLYGAQLPSALGLQVASDVSPATVVNEAKAARLGGYLKFSTPSKQLSDADNGISSQLAPFTVLQRALLLVSFISVLSTLLLVGIQRRREFGLLAAVGASPRDLFRMILAEGLTVSVVGTVLGAAFGLGVLWIMLNVTPLLVGYVDTYSPDVGSIFVYGPIAIIVAIAASLWPGRQAARTPILEALTYE